MSNGNRSQLADAVTALFIAAVLFFSAWAVWDWSASYTRNTIEADRAARRYAADAIEDIKRTCIDPATMAECVTKIMQSTHENQRSEFDLSAQQDMANWAWWMVAVSLFSTAVTAIGIYFVRQNLIAVREANAGSRDSYNLAEQNSKRELRAYLSVSPEGINQLRVRPEAIGHILIKNVGHVIANNVRLMVNMIPSHDRHLDPTISNTSNDLRPIGSILPNAEVRRGSYQTVGIGIVERREEPPTYLFVWGSVEYDDGFGSHATTNFCHRYNCESFDGGFGRLISIDKRIGRNHEYGNHAT